MHISDRFDNENGAPVPDGFVAGDIASNSGLSSAMRNKDRSGNSYLRLHLKP